MREKRKHPRYPHYSSVKIEFNDGSHQRGEVLNISIGGLLIKTDPLPAFGERVQIHIELPGEPGRSVIPCIVRWIKEDIGVGLQFERRRQMKSWALKRLKSALETGQI